MIGFEGPVVKANAVTLADYAFKPSRITVPAGTKVVFTNAGKEVHNAASADNGGWDTGMLRSGQSAGVTFNRPGTYSFSCAPHPSMIGQIVVTGSVTGTAIESAPPITVDRSAAALGNAPATMPARAEHDDH